MEPGPTKPFQSLIGLADDDFSPLMSMLSSSSTFTTSLQEAVNLCGEKFQQAIKLWEPGRATWLMLSNDFWRLTTWAREEGVFTSGNASADYRLRGPNPVRNIFLLHLQQVDKNLAIVMGKDKKAPTTLHRVGAFLVDRILWGSDSATSTSNTSSGSGDGKAVYREGPLDLTPLQEITHNITTLCQLSRGVKDLGCEIPRQHIPASERDKQRVV